WRRLRELHEAGILTGEIWRELEAQHNAQRQRLDKEMHALYLDYNELERELVLAARREALRSERVAISEAMRRGLITDDAYRILSAEVDQRLAGLQDKSPPDEPERGKSPS